MSRSLRGIGSAAREPVPRTARCIVQRRRGAGQQDSAGPPRFLAGDTPSIINPAGSLSLGRSAKMGFKLDRVHVWSGEVTDRAGGVAAKLSALAQAGANLEFVLTRRSPDKPGFGLLYVAQVTGPSQVRAARAAGLKETHDPVVLRVEGDNQAGLAHRLTQQWALAGISLQELTMAVVGGKFVGYAAFDTVADANRAAAILGDLGAGG